MPLHFLFPTPVMQVDLTPDDGIAEAMYQQLEIFDRIIFGDPQFSSRDNLTGDRLGISGLDQLHLMNEFSWLNQQIGEQVLLYLTDISGPDHGLEVHIQKAWPVVCSRDGGTIPSHTHRNSQLSAVFYVRTEDDANSGELQFQAPAAFFSNAMAIPSRETTVSGGVFAPKQHRLLIFPSNLPHQVLPYEGSGPRYSVSYDLAVTTAPGQGREMLMPHPMDWVPHRL